MRSGNIAVYSKILFSKNSDLIETSQLMSNANLLTDS